MSAVRARPTTFHRYGADKLAQERKHTLTDEAVHEAVEELLGQTAEIGRTFERRLSSRGNG